MGRTREQQKLTLVGCEVSVLGVRQSDRLLGPGSRVWEEVRAPDRSQTSDAAVRETCNSRLPLSCLRLLTGCVCPIKIRLLFVSEVLTQVSWLCRLD